MGKSLIPQIAEMLGVGFDEEFKIQDFRGNPIDSVTYKFDENTLLYKHQGTGKFYIASSGTLLSLLDGGYEIVKLPWKPRLDETYYTFCLENFSSFHWRIFKADWFETPTDFARLKAGWVYRTYAEAKEALPIVAKETGVNYILEG